MKNKLKKVVIGIGISLVLISGQIVFSEPGSQSDPLVTLSYVDMKMQELRTYIDQKLNVDIADSKKDTWEVVELFEGKSIIGKGGTEIILRSGKGSSISNISTVTKNGKETKIDNGLTDVTDGLDLKFGVSIPTNHLLIIPRDDGRGLLAISDSFLLVKGDYEIK